MELLKLDVLGYVFTGLMTQDAGMRWFWNVIRMDKTTIKKLLLCAETWWLQMSWATKTTMVGLCDR